jgi:hypothetical protein
LFGFEFQTNANLFQSGVKERETAFEHKSKLLTLEGDETHDFPDLSELEFVTAPCDSLSKAQEATGYATALAEALREKWESPGRSGLLKFEKGEEYVGGTWVRDCTISIENHPFEAQPQATIGVPLAGLPAFLCTALRGVGDEKFASLMENEMLPRARDALTARGVEQPSPELIGFLSACHYFIWRAMNDYADGVAVEVSPGGNASGFKEKRLRAGSVPGCAV